MKRRFGLFVLVVILAAGPNGCRNHDMYSHPTTSAASTS